MLRPVCACNAVPELVLQIPRQLLVRLCNASGRGHNAGRDLGHVCVRGSPRVPLPEQKGRLEGERPENDEWASWEVAGEVVQLHAKSRIGLQSRRPSGPERGTDLPVLAPRVEQWQESLHSEGTFLSGGWTDLQILTCRKKRNFTSLM
jgi:hypothetical protein